jgi:hypothetical protein
VVDCPQADSDAATMIVSAPSTDVRQVADLAPTGSPSTLIGPSRRPASGPERILPVNDRLRRRPLDGLRREARRSVHGVVVTLVAFTVVRAGRG